MRASPEILAGIPTAGSVASVLAAGRVAALMGRVAAEGWSP